MRFSTLSKTLLFVAVATVAVQVSGQDLHFSQYDILSSTLNPGLVGNYDGSYRLAAIYRNQWTSALAKDGYETVGAEADFCLLEGYLKSDKLAIGVGFYNDRVGAAGQSTTSADLTVAYHKALDKKGMHRLSLGLQGAFIQYSVDDPIFGDQFSAFNANPALPAYTNATREIFTHSVYKFDFNTGLYWRSNFNNKVKLGLGFAGYHLITPDLALVTKQTGGLDNTNVDLPRRYDADLNLEIFTRDKKFSVTPEFLFMYQGPFTEYLPGASVTYYFNTGFRNNNSVSVGVRYRSGGNTPDAVIPMANVEFRNVRFGFSYDANISGLATSTLNRGAFELSLVYIGETVKSYKENKSLPARRF